MRGSQSTLWGADAVGGVINIVTKKLVINYKSGTHNNVFHPKAYSKMPESKFWQASITPSGYQNMFDAFGNSLAIFLELGETSFRNKVIQYSEVLRKKPLSKKFNKNY